MTKSLSKQALSKSGLNWLISIVHAGQVTKLVVRPTEYASSTACCIKRPLQTAHETGMSSPAQFCSRHVFPILGRQQSRRQALLQPKDRSNCKVDASRMDSPCPQTTEACSLGFNGTIEQHLQHGPLSVVSGATTALKNVALGCGIGIAGAMSGPVVGAASGKGLMGGVAGGILGALAGVLVLVGGIAAGTAAAVDNLVTGIINT